MSAVWIASVCSVALLIAISLVLRRIWAQQAQDPEFRVAPWVGMSIILVLAGTVLGFYTWRAQTVLAKTDQPPMIVNASAETGRWTFTARGSVRPPQRDLRLRGGRPVHLRLAAGAEDIEFFVPGLGLKKELKAGEKAELRFRPPSPSRVGEAAVYSSVCLKHCRGGTPVQPFVVVVEAPRGVLAY